MLDQGLTLALTGSRFERVLHPSSRDQPTWDTVLAKTADYIVVPTLGSIIPSWHLVIPRTASLNMHEHLAARGSDDIRAVLNPVVGGRRFGRTLWFEHGPRSVGSPVGCGTDYAHLHVIVDPPFSLLDFYEVAQTFLPDWKATTTENVYGELISAKEYYVFGDHQRAFVAYAGDRPISQMFRKVVANLVSKPNEWDYRLHAHERSAQRTIELWRHNSTNPSSSDLGIFASDLVGQR